MTAPSLKELSRKKAQKGKEQGQDTSPFIFSYYLLFSFLRLLCLFAAKTARSHSASGQPAALEQYLGDLHCVGRGPLAQVVGHHPQVQAIGHARVAAYSAHEHLV